MTANLRHWAVMLALALAMTAGTANAQKHKELGRMWTFENPPLEWFEEAYGFKPSSEWMDHARLSALRFADGCSSSFVSPRGLIMTNHHCARGNVGSASPEDQDYLENGYFARSLKEEIKLAGLTVQQLVKQVNVTEAVNTALKEQEMDQITKDLIANGEKENPGLKAELVTLYQGGMYQLYFYKIYDDIRLVASPELQAAKFGGDPDNFTFPRYSLDFAFVRAYEDDKPADTSKHYFKWRTEGPAENELVFVVGHPGSTGRLKTVAQIEFQRDIYYPMVLEIVDQRLAQTRERAKQSPEAKKQLTSEILRWENTQKAFRGFLEGLRKDSVVDVKRKAEKDTRERIASDEELSKKYGGAWDEVAAIVKEKRERIAAGAGLREMRPFNVQEAKLEKQIGEAFFAVYGTEIPPDATFSLRISDGLVKGFPMNGTVAPWFTSLYGLYARNVEFGNQDPFHLTNAWLTRQGRLDLSTPFNLVSTCDIIGGNSGSPMINREQEIVGLVFDGNIESLSNNYIFTDDIPRTVCVHPAIIIESLRKVYDCPLLADEIEGRGKGNQ